MLRGTKRPVYYVPGEHDTSTDGGKAYMERYRKGTKGSGWYSFDQKGVQFIGLVNVMALDACPANSQLQTARITRRCLGTSGWGINHAI
jgi:hypothetical protein